MKKPDLKIMKLRTGEATRDVYLRNDSSDTMLVGDIFVDKALHLSRTHRASELVDWLDRCRATPRRPLIVDAGANIGLSCIVLSAQAPDALIVALEPEASNYGLLLANTRSLPVLPLPVALAAEPGCVVVEDPGDGEWAYRTRSLDETHVETAAVSAVTIDEIFAAHRETCVPYIVKIDIEGAEEGVFNCDAKWIDETPLIIVELHDWMLPKARTAQPVLRRLVQSDRDFIVLGENLISMAIDLPDPASQLPGGPS
ncbi:FkbM family methyltransferase [Roseobacter sp. MH60115]|uniref:FkbM family methyltransferase n=1 Tax=Roseobacter sp. MH60115 TaxID=2785324 RepID=UPI0018A2F17D|nr:FkbM family methyltransferase [Roseobacter sp. MH60115]